MDETAAFFSQIASRDREEKKFMEDIIFLAAHEWHFTPEELLDIEIPMLYLLLRKQYEYNKEQEKGLKRR